MVKFKRERRRAGRQRHHRWIIVFSTGKKAAGCVFKDKLFGGEGGREAGCAAGRTGYGSNAEYEWFSISLGEGNSLRVQSGE